MASSLGFPFERVERDRRLFGETQSVLRMETMYLDQRYLRGDRWDRHQEVRLGIEVLHHLLFGIETKRSRISMCGNARMELSVIFGRWEDGKYGDPEGSESAARFIIAAGRAIREQVEERHARLGRMEKRLKDAQGVLDQSDLEPERRDFVGAIEIGLRFLLFCHYGRPFGDDRRIADEFIAAAMQIHQERISGALGAEPKATFRWIVEIGRALREHTLDFDSATPYRPFPPSVSGLT